MDRGKGKGEGMKTRRYRLWRSIGAVALVCAFAWAPGSASALDPDKALTQYHYEYWLPEDGLPQISVQSVVQDPRGYLWIGTQEGLVRFDGVRFTIFDSRNTPAVTNNYITDQLLARDGTLWAGTFGGGLLKVREGVVSSLQTADGLASDIVHALAEGLDGEIWIGTEKGLNRLHDGELEIYTTDEGLPHELVQALLVDHTGTLWVGTHGGGVVRHEHGVFNAFARPLASDLISVLYEAPGGAVWIGTVDVGLYRYLDGQLLHMGGEQGLTSERMVAVHEDGDENLWVGTYDGGLCRLEGDHFNCFTTAEGLVHDHITDFEEDVEGNLWFGSLGGGLNRFRDAKFTSIGTAEGLSHPGVWVVLEGSRGLWVGTENGLDLFVDGKPVDYPGRQAAAEDSLMAVYEAPDGTVWTGLYGGGLRRLSEGRWTTYTTANDLADDQVFSITQDREGALWIGTRSGLNRLVDGQFTTFTTENGLPHDNIKALHVDSKGVLWVGTRGGGLARFLYDEFIPFEIDEELTANQKLVYSIHEDEDGVLWFGTFGGLIRHKDGRSDIFTIRDGLHDDAAYQILEDGRGNLWMSCNRGVYSVSKDDLALVAEGRKDRVKSTAYGRADGMPSTECNGGSQPAGWRTADGCLWFPTVDGVASIDPLDVERNPIPPPVLIESVEVDGVPVDPQQELVLPPGRKRLEFRFTAPSLTAAERVEFKTLLAGAERSWTEPDTRRDVVYSSLSHGDYTFRVTASNNDGVWNDLGASFRFTIQPHFYETIWFYLLCLATLLAAVFGTQGVRVLRLKRRADELSRAVDERTHELRKMADELKELSLRDPLTGLRNRRFLFETLATLMEDLARQTARQSAGAADRRGRQSGDVVGLFMVDIDHFKAVNDTHGHDAGDAVLRRFADLLRESVRTEDIVVRWGGEEFLVVLPRTRYDALATFAEKLRSSVAETAFEIPGGELHKTCSVGYTSLPFADRPEEDLTLEQAITVADLGLYRAKRDGRNRTVHLNAGPQWPSDPETLATALSDLDWALNKDYLAIED